MALKLIDDSVVTDFAQAIRDRDGTSDNLTFDEIKNVISESIPNDTSIKLFESNTESIRKSAFINCANLTDVSLPNITTVPKYAFKGTENLTKIDLPSVTVVEESGFENSGLTSITLHNVNTIKKDAFKNSSNLSDVYILSSDSVSLENSSAFEGTPIVNSNTAHIFLHGNIYESMKSSTDWAELKNKLIKYYASLQDVAESNEFLYTENVENGSVIQGTIIYSKSEKLNIQYPIHQIYTDEADIELNGGDPNYYIWESTTLSGIKDFVVSENKIEYFKFEIPEYPDMEHMMMPYIKITDATDMFTHYSNAIIAIEEDIE